MITLQEAVQLWKHDKIKSCTMNFSCGGDSMNDYNFTFHNEEDNEVENEALKDFFENSVFNHVDFYEASDGYYLGEFGTVEITLDDNGDDFDYMKCATSEYSESIRAELFVPIDNETKDILNKYISNINGSNSDGTNTNYKVDCILNEHEIALIEKLENTIYKAVEGYEPEFPDNASDDDNNDFTFSTNNLDDDEIIEITDKGLKVVASYDYTSHGESID